MADVALSGLLLDSPHSGTATYTRNLAAELPRVAGDLTFALYARNTGWMSNGVRRRSIHTPLERWSGTPAGARLDKLLWETVALPIAAASDRSRLIHSLYFAAPVIAASPLVVTIHDLILLVVPGYHRSRQSAWYSRFMTHTVRRADAIITVSEHARRDIVRVLKVPEERVHVTYEAADPRFSPDGQADEKERVSRKYRLPRRFLLYVGGAERRKNLEMLVRAWAGVSSEMRRRDVSLVIVADFPPPDPLYPDIPGQVREAGLEGQVVLVPRVADEDMPALYRSALGFCFPSRYEGFGLTPLEAMASATPVLAADATSLPEVAGDAAWLLPPDEPSQWAAAMLELVDSEACRGELRAKGLRRSADFTWERTARETVEVYREVLSRCGS